MMRLDKFLVAMEIGSRSQIKDLVKKGLVCVNGVPCKTADLKIDEENDLIEYKGQRLKYHRFSYYILHKPQGVVTATHDLHDKTVMDLLNADDRRKDLFPVGRLDKDTEGLLLITNDGELAHLLLSPKRHVEKTYLVHLKDCITESDMEDLRNGVDIGEDAPTLPAKVVKISDKIIELTIHEGKFHQVKRMLNAVNNEVIYLKRLTFGCLHLEDSLKLGEYRSLSEKEIEALCSTVPVHRQ